MSFHSFVVKKLFGKILNTLFHYVITGIIVIIVHTGKMFTRQWSLVNKQMNTMNKPAPQKVQKELQAKQSKMNNLFDIFSAIQMNLKQHKSRFAQQLSRLRFLEVSRHKPDRYTMRQNTPNSRIKRKLVSHFEVRSAGRSMPTPAYPRKLGYFASCFHLHQHKMLRVSNCKWAKLFFLLSLPGRFMYKSCGSFLFSLDAKTTPPIRRYWGGLGTVMNRKWQSKSVGKFLNQS